MTWIVRNGTDAQRRASPYILAPGHMGSTSDTGELLLGAEQALAGVYPVPPSVPADAKDVRRLWTVASRGQQDTWTDIGSATRDGSGQYLTPKASAGTDPVAFGYVAPYELADGGEIVITAVGTYTCGSVFPKILAKLKIGNNYQVPQYEATAPNYPIVADVAFVTTDCFEWSMRTVGYNAIAGYEALWLSASNMTKGEFQWRLTMRVHALGKDAKWQRGDDDHTGDDDANCWVEATLEWGALQYNAGGRHGECYGFANPQSVLTTQYNAFMPSGVVRGNVYSFLGQQWLCHASSTSTALSGGNAVRNNWTDMLAEEAPGVGAHWREFFVPLVSKATFSAFTTVDWEEGHRIELELGGPTQEDTALAWLTTYGATTLYLPEQGASPYTGANRGIVSGSIVHVPKIPLYATPHPHMMNGTGSAQWTAGITDRRAWRQLPLSLRDEMKVQHTHGFLFGRKNGVAERRIR